MLMEYPMIDTRLVIAVIATALLTATTIAIVDRPALAQAPRTAICTAAIKPEKVPAVVNVARQSDLFVSPMADWMNQQLAEGRTQFVMTPADSVGMALCAW